MAATSQPAEKAPAGPVKCDACGAEFPNEEALADHKQKVHIDPGEGLEPAPTPK